MARKRHATATHMKPKLYFPSVAVVPADLKSLRPCTNAALCNVSVLSHGKKDNEVNGSRHQGGSNCLEEESNRAEGTGQEATNATAQGEETKNEGANREEEGDELEGEHEARF